MTLLERVGDGVNPTLRVDIVEKPLKGLALYVRVCVGVCVCVWGSIEGKWVVEVHAEAVAGDLLGPDAVARPDAKV